MKKLLQLLLTFGLSGATLFANAQNKIGKIVGQVIDGNQKTIDDCWASVTGNNSTGAG